MTEEQADKLAYMLKRQAMRLDELSGKPKVKTQPRKKVRGKPAAKKHKAADKGTDAERNARSRQYYDFDRAAFQHMRDL